MATLTLQKYPSALSSAFDDQKFIVFDENYIEQDFQYIAKINIFDPTDEADIVATIKVKPYFQNGYGYFDIGNILTQYVNTLVRYETTEDSDDMHSDHQELIKYNIIWEYYYVGNTGTAYAGTYDTVTNGENEYWIFGSYARYEYFLSQANVVGYFSPSVDEPGHLLNGADLPGHNALQNYNDMYATSLQSISGLVCTDINGAQVSDTVHIHTVTKSGLTKDFYYKIITTSSTDLTTQLQHFTFSLDSLNTLTADSIILSGDPSEYTNPDSISCEDATISATFSAETHEYTNYVDFWLPSSGELLTLIDVLDEIPNSYVNDFFILTDCIYASSTNVHELNITDCAIYEQGGWTITGQYRETSDLKFIPCHIITSSIEYSLKDWLYCGFIFEKEESGGEWIYKVANLFNIFNAQFSANDFLLPDTTGQFGQVATSMIETALIAGGYYPVGGGTPESGVLNVTVFEAYREDLTTFINWYIPNIQDMADIINTGCGFEMNTGKKYGTSEPKTPTNLIPVFKWSGVDWIIDSTYTHREDLMNYYIIHRFYSEEDFAIGDYAKCGYAFRKQSFSAGWYYWVCRHREKHQFSNNTDTTSYWLFGGDSVTMTTILYTELSNLGYNRDTTYIIDAYESVIHNLQTSDEPEIIFLDTHLPIVWNHNCCDPTDKSMKMFQIGYTNILGGTSYFNVCKKYQTNIETEKNFYKIYNRDYPDLMTRNNKVINATSKSSIIVNSDYFVNDVQIWEVEQIISSPNLVLHQIGATNNSDIPCILKKYKFNNSPLRNGLKQVEFELEFDYDNKITF